MQAIDRELRTPARAPGRPPTYPLPSTPTQPVTSDPPATHTGPGANLHLPPWEAPGSQALPATSCRGRGQGEAPALAHPEAVHGPHPPPTHPPTQAARPSWEVLAQERASRRK